MGIKKFFSKFAIPRLRRDDGDGGPDEATDQTNRVVPAPQTDDSQATRRFAVPTSQVYGYQMRGRPAGATVPLDAPIPSPVLPFNAPYGYADAEAQDRAQRRFAVPSQASATAASPDAAPPTAEGIDYDPQRTNTRPRIEDPRGYLTSRIADEEAMKPENHNSHFASAIKTGAKLFLRSLRGGGGLGPALLSGSVGLVGGAVHPAWDEEISRDENVSRDRRRVARLDASEDAGLKRLKARAEIADIYSRPGQRRAQEENQRRGDLLQTLTLRKYYRRGEDPQFDSELDRYHLRVGDFDNRKDATNNRIPIQETGDDGKPVTLNVTPGEFLSRQTTKHKESEKQDYTYADGSKGRISPEAKARLEELKLSHNWEQDYKVNRDEATRRANQEKSVQLNSDADSFMAVANEEALRANEAFQRGQSSTDPGEIARAKDEFTIHNNESERNREKARQARRAAQDAETKAKSQPAAPTPHVYRRKPKGRSGGGSTYNVDMGRYGLSP